MRNLSVLLIITFIFSVLGACSPDARDEGSANLTVKPTAEFPRPKLIKEEGYTIARGATEAKEINVVYDSMTKSMNLKGKIEYIPMHGQALKTVHFDLIGVIDDEGYIKLKNVKAGSSQPEEKIVAKATCLSEPGTCNDSFIDIYLYVDGVVYHHQIESHQELPLEESNKNKSEKTDNVADEEEKNAEDVGTETESDDDEGEAAGQYIGSVTEDIKTLLEIEPENTQKDQPITDAKDSSQEKKDKAETEKAPSKDAPRKEEPKKQEPKKDAPKKIEPKKVEPKKVEPKKDEPKKDTKKDKTESTESKDSKNKDPKKGEDEVDSKNGDSKSIDIKKEEPKKEEPKKDAGPLLKTIRQAIGAVNAGHLENAVDFLSYEKKYSPTGFHVITPARKTYFATNEMMHVIAKMGFFTKQFISGHLLLVGDMSYRNGGRLGRHKSHQNGLDADIAYFFDNKSFDGFFASAVAVDKVHPNWMAQEQWKLFKNMVQTQFVDRIFVHKVLKKHLCSLAIKNGEIDQSMTSGIAYETLRRLRPRPKDHHNHFHLRVKCSKAQSRCRPMAEPAPGSGCF